MPIDLTRVNISLAQFQDISSGKYNAGEVRLSDETSLAKMNNHVHLWGRNVETISHEETLTIKDAFVRALANNGVGADALNAVRRELGLAPDGKADQALLERSMKPLSRQQIREILDRNAAAINAAQGVGTIVTDAQMHKGPRASMHAATRDATNAVLDGSRTTSTSADIARAQTLIGGDVEFQSSDERANLLTLAISQKTLIMTMSAGNPSTAPGGKIAVGFESSGNYLSATLELGMSEADYVDKLDDIIMRLSGGDAPSEEDLAARAEFKALSSADSDAWLAKMASDPAANGQKARAVAVLILQERGVNDVETLSLVNRLGNADAVLLASSLVKADGNLKGNALLQSAGVRLLVAAAANNPAEVPEAQQTYIPGISSKDFNEKIYQGLAFGFDELPAAFAKMAHDVRAELAGRLGVEALPDDSYDSVDNLLRGLVDSSDLAALIPHDDDDVARVTPESIRDGFLKGALEKGANKLLADCIFNYASDHGLNVGNARPIIQGLLARTPNLIESLAACRTPDEATAILDGISADARFQADMVREHAIGECLVSADSLAREALAAELDLNVPDLFVPGGVNTMQVAELSQKLCEKIHSGEVSASTPAEVQAAFRDMAAHFASGRAEALRSLDSRQISPELRTGLRTAVLQMYNTDSLNLDAIFAAAREVDFSEVVSLVDAKEEMSKVCTAMGKVAARVADAAQDIVKAQGASEGIGDIESLINQIVIDQTPGGVKAIETFLDRADLPTTAADIGKQPIDPSRYREMLSTRSGSIIVKQLTIRPIERSFLDGIGAVRASEAGYLQSELPSLARTFAMCRAAGMSAEDAMAAVLDPTSKPRRLVRYGGRFTESIENFSQGLKLQNKFDEWFTGVCRSTDIESGTTISHFNSLMRDPALAGTIERFVFEEIAVNGNIPLDASNPEDMFGMEKNPAMNFIGRISSHALAHAVTHTPPAMRGLVYEVFATINPRSEGLAALDHFYYHDTLVARTFTNYDALVSLRDAGMLNRDNIIRQLFPETIGMPTETNDKLMTAISRVGLATEKLADLNASPGDYESANGFRDAQMAKQHAYRRLLNSGIHTSFIGPSLESGMRWADTIPISMGSTFNNAGMCSVANPAKCEREAMRDLILSPTAPTWAANWTKVVPEANNHFVFRFADGTELAHPQGNITSGDVDRMIDAVADKIENLCGTVHQEQLAAVYRALSSDGGTPLVNFFLQQGISTDARCPLVQTIMRDEATGIVSIMHSNPEGFPVNFSWTTSIAVDGSIASTPIFTSPAQTA